MWWYIHCTDRSISPAFAKFLKISYSFLFLYFKPLAGFVKFWGREGNVFHINKVLDSQQHLGPVRYILAEGSVVDDLIYPEVNSQFLLVQGLGGGEF